MRLHGLSDGLSRTIEHSGGQCDNRIRRKDILAALSASLLQRSVIDAGAVWGDERILVVADGKEVGDDDDIAEGSHVVAMQRWSIMGSERIRVGFGRTVLELPAAGSVKELGIDLYARGATNVIPIEQKIIINGKNIDKHVLLGDVALFCPSGSKLNATVVRSSGTTAIREAEYSQKESEPRRCTGLQKLPKRKRSCTDSFRGLGPMTRQKRVEYRDVSLTDPVFSPPLTPVK